MNSLNLTRDIIRYTRYIQHDLIILYSYLFCQAGVLRSADETRQRLEEQLYHATYGIEKRVTDLQTKYGTKDKITQYWINILLQKAREIKANQPGRPSDSISVELRQWLSEQPGDKMNPLLTIDGTLTIIIPC